MKVIILLALSIVIWFSNDGFCATIPTVYDRHDSFLSAVPNASLESFESDDIGFAIIQNRPMTSLGRVQSGNIGGLHPTDGSRYYVWNSGPDRQGFGSSNNTSITLEFRTYITAVGLFVVDFGDTQQPEGYTGALVLSTPQHIVAPGIWRTDPPIRTNGNQLFKGIVSSEPFRSVTILATTINDDIEIDEIWYMSIPEPPINIVQLIAAILLIRRRHVI